MRGFVLLNVHFVADISEYRRNKGIEICLQEQSLCRFLKPIFWTPLETTQAAEEEKKNLTFSFDEI